LDREQIYKSSIYYFVHKQTHPHSAVHTRRQLRADSVACRRPDSGHFGSYSYDLKYNNTVIN